MKKRQSQRERQTTTKTDRVPTSGAGPSYVKNNRAAAIIKTQKQSKKKKKNKKTKNRNNI